MSRAPASVRGGDGGDFQTGLSRTVFMNEPLREKRIYNTEDMATVLVEERILPTTLIDYLTQNALSEQHEYLPKDLLLSSSNATHFLATMLNNPSRYPPDDPKKLASARKKFSPYGLGSFRVLFPLCCDLHFVAVDVIFNRESARVFDRVHIYDSFGPKKGPVRKESSPGKFLKDLQTFLVRFCFHNDDEEEEQRTMKTRKARISPSRQLLRSDPDFILKKSSYRPCPT